MRSKLRRMELCRSLAGNVCDLLTITERSPPPREDHCDFDPGHSYHAHREGRGDSAATGHANTDANTDARTHPSFDNASAGPIQTKESNAGTRPSWLQPRTYQAHTHKAHTQSTHTKHIHKAQSTKHAHTKPTHTKHTHKAHTQSTHTKRTHTKHAHKAHS